MPSHGTGTPTPNISAPIVLGTDPPDGVTQTNDIAYLLDQTSDTQDTLQGGVVEATAGVPAGLAVTVGTSQAVGTQRMECSGAPLLVTFTGMAYAASATGVVVNLGVLTDGTSSVGSNSPALSQVILTSTNEEKVVAGSVVIVLPAGSHIFQFAAATVPSGTASYDHGVFSVVELVRQPATNNGTT